MLPSVEKGVAIRWKIEYPIFAATGQLSTTKNMLGANANMLTLAMSSKIYILIVIVLVQLYVSYKHKIKSSIEKTRENKDFYTYA